MRLRFHHPLISQLTAFAIDFRCECIFDLVVFNSVMGQFMKSLRLRSLNVGDALVDRFIVGMICPSDNGSNWIDRWLERILIAPGLVDCLFDPNNTNNNNITQRELGYTCT